MTQPGETGAARSRASFLSQRSAGVSGRPLRPNSKVLPEHARGHNRALVLQTLFTAGQQSRADVARSTGLTRVTVSDLVTELMAEALVVETGQRDGPRPGKPAILLDIDRAAFQIVGIDLSDSEVFRGAVLDLGGTILHRVELPIAGSAGEAALQQVFSLIEDLLAVVTAPLLGIGVGSPGIVDLAGSVVSAPNLHWTGLPLQAKLSERFGVPVVVTNDANAAVLAEHSYGDAQGDLMLVRVGRGVGAGLLLGGTLLHGSRFAAGEIGHVVVGTDGGELCSCGKHGCLETWLAAPRLEAKLRQADDDADPAARRAVILREAGTRLGIALAPIVGALNLSEVVLSGPDSLLGGSLTEATLETIRGRTMDRFHGGLALRLSTLGNDIVLRGAAVMVISSRLGVS
ncbi:ROK family transcriptional regulator [Glaciihabitans sp. INWT7]|uniref:ROK family transcriptional regulator n=1 Tax=Glaciihabitans sp. INWT7 TaxID=2596912 RepID=UPI00162766E0|nr:ROK family protein [Glaciihabitans sp. INWT7]QNE47864.1 ROK family transcriptional regulator [Glaciihabitans sp. INWT7]